MIPNNNENIPWIEKYRPRKLEDIKQTTNLIELFKNSIATGEMTHYLFYGPPGTGKTSVILALGREIFGEYFPARVIEFNASDDRGINAVREKITNEARKYVTEIITEDRRIPPYKIIILDEADSMTDEAQDALRVIIEQYSTVARFCFICNYISKITDAIKSRCSMIYFKKLDDECMIEKINEIAKKESMDLPENIYKVIIDVSNGDMRKAIMLLQNLKYLYNYKQTLHKPIKDLTAKELQFLPMPSINREPVDLEIKEEDIYKLAAYIPISEANSIIQEVLACEKIVEIVEICQRIIAYGYPIDNILVQLNKCVLESKIDDQKKARIINYSGGIFYKINESANEYIQILDYLSCLNGIYHGNKSYD